MHTFKHDLLTPFTIDRIDGPSGRIYQLWHDDGYVYNFKSVTAALSQYYGTASLDNWKKAVGEETANKIGAQARNRGTAMHSIYERFLLNEDYAKDTMPINLSDFEKVKPYLINLITKVRGIELKLYSNKLKMAGTTDAFVELKGIPTILDFKTSKKPKKIKYLESYFVQATIYAMMIEELYGIEVPQIMIVMTIDHDLPRLYLQETEKYKPIVEKVIEKVLNENIH